MIPPTWAPIPRLLDVSEVLPSEGWPGPGIGVLYIAAAGAITAGVNLLTKWLTTRIEDASRARRMDQDHQHDGHRHHYDDDDE